MKPYSDDPANPQIPTNIVHLVRVLFIDPATSSAVSRLIPANRVNDEVDAWAGITQQPFDELGERRTVLRTKLDGRRHLYLLAESGDMDDDIPLERYWRHEGSGQRFCGRGVLVLSKALGDYESLPFGDEGDRIIQSVSFEEPPYCQYPLQETTLH